MSGIQYNRDPVLWKGAIDKTASAPQRKGTDTVVARKCSDLRDDAVNGCDLPSTNTGFFFVWKGSCCVQLTFVDRGRLSYVAVTVAC